MDVTTDEEARIAEEAGAVAVMALERVPADIRKEGGVARMSDPTMIAAIKKAVTIPVMAKARIGHFVEAQILEALEVDYVDESEVKTPISSITSVCIPVVMRNRPAPKFFVMVMMQMIIMQLCGADKCACIPSCCIPSC